MVIDSAQKMLSIERMISIDFRKPCSSIERKYFESLPVDVPGFIFR